LFALVSFAGLGLIIVGFGLSGDKGRLFAPVPAAVAIAPYAMVASFVLFAAANMRSHIRQALKHPMLLGLLIWSLVHLLAAGDVKGTVLFGAFFAYAVIDLISATARGAVKTFVPSTKHDVIAIVAGTLLALVVMTFHRSLFGVAVVPFAR